MFVFFSTFWASLAQLLLAFAPVLATFFSRLPILIAALVIFMLAWNVFVLAAETLLMGIMPSIPQTVSTVWGWVMPTNISTLFLAMYSSKLARFAFDMQHELLKLKKA